MTRIDRTRSHGIFNANNKTHWNHEDSVTKDPKALPSDCDVVVIGSGAGGLTAAGLLARAGMKTVVLEADSQAGGYMAGFSRKGFHFDSSVHWLNQMAPGEIVHDLWSMLGDVPNCPPMTRIHRYKGDTYDYTLTSNPLELRDQLIADFPDDEEGIRRFFEDARALSARLQKVGRLRSRKCAGPLEKLWRNLKLAYWGTPILKYIRTPIEDGLRGYFKSPELRKVFCSQESLMPIIVPVCWAFDGSFQMPPKGGCPTLVDWLCDRLEAYGGQLFLRSRVESILVGDNGLANGVRLADGKEIACNYVVAACDLHLLYNSLFPKSVASSDFMNALKDAELYPSAFSIFLGVDCSPAEFGLGEEVLNLTVANASRDEHMSGDPKTSILMIIAPSVRDPSMAPEGKGTIMIHCPTWFDYEDQWRTGEGFERGEAYEKLKREFADAILERVEETVAPGLRAHVEVTSTATPITYWRYTLNEKGTIMGTKPCRHNIREGLSRYTTPVKNVWIGGHGADVGGGIPIAASAGANACLAVLKAAGSKTFEEVKRVLDHDV